VQFKQTPALVKLEAKEQNLTLTVLNQQTFQMWRSDLKSFYLEDISSKTGQAKSYAEFVQMLSSALEARDSSTYVDLLDMHDLQLLKGKTPPAKETEDPRAPSKRYLIVTNLN
jgi:cyanate lyase